jgi:hypothetical protein
MDAKGMTFTCNIELGATYKDEVTGWEGKATAVCFGLTGVPQITLEGIDQHQDLRGYRFDADRLLLTQEADSPVVDIRENTERLNRDLVGAGGGARH